MKNARKFLLKALVSEKEIHTAMFLKLCAASLFKVLYTDANFLPKLRKCCHEGMVDNCSKSGVVALQVAAVEVMTFFSKISTIPGYNTRFPEIVARRSGDFQITPLAINGNRFAWLVCREI